MSLIFPFLISKDQIEDFFILLWRNSIRGDHYSDEALRIICGEFFRYKPRDFDAIGIFSNYAEYNWEEFINYHSDCFDEYLQEHYKEYDNLQDIIDIEDKFERTGVINEIIFPNLVGYNKQNVYVNRV